MSLRLKQFKGQINTNDQAEQQRFTGQTDANDSITISNLYIKGQSHENHMALCKTNARYTTVTLQQKPVHNILILHRSVTEKY